MLTPEGASQRKSKFHREESQAILQQACSVVFDFIAETFKLSN